DTAARQTQADLQPQPRRRRLRDRRERREGPYDGAQGRPENVLSPLGLSWRFEGDPLPAYVGEPPRSNPALRRQGHAAQDAPGATAVAQAEDLRRADAPACGTAAQGLRAAAERVERKT